jgi:hypothetical protein
MSLWFRHGIFAREAGGNGAKLAAIPLGNLAIRATVVLRPGLNSAATNKAIAGVVHLKDWLGWSSLTRNSNRELASMNIACLVPAVLLPTVPQLLLAHKLVR